MAIQRFDKLDFTYSDKRFVIDLPAPIVSITGESGVGKSYLADALRDKIANKKLKDVVCLDYLNFDLMIETVMAGKDKLIVIDNADLVLCQSDADDLSVWGERFRADQGNQYLLMTRNGSLLGAQMEDISFLTYKDGVFRNDFPWRKLREMGCIQ